MTTTPDKAAAHSVDAPVAEAPAKPAPAAAPKAERPYSPGLEGVIAAETAVGYVDGANGRLLYRGYPIGQLVEKGTYGRVAELLWTGEWRKSARLVPAEIPFPCYVWDWDLDRLQEEIEAAARRADRLRAQMPAARRGGGSSQP